MAFRFEIPVRFPDVDYARVLYFPRFFDYCHRTFEEFFSAEVGIPYVDLIDKRGLGFPTVRAEADYRAPLRFGETCSVTLETLALGGRSITCRYRLGVQGEPRPRAEIRVVTAAITLPAFQSIDVPADIARAFARHQVAESR